MNNPTQHPEIRMTSLYESIFGDRSTITGQAKKAKISQKDYLPGYEKKLEEFKKDPYKESFIWAYNKENHITQLFDIEPPIEILIGISYYSEYSVFINISYNLKHRRFICPFRVSLGDYITPDKKRDWDTRTAETDKRAFIIEVATAFANHPEMIDLNNPEKNIYKWPDFKKKFINK